MKCWMRSLLLLAAIWAPLGCTSFNQVYHFQSRSTAPDGTPNYFRVRVTGDAQAARTRYIAGFYDERAVDMFFNETRSTNGELRPIFVSDQKAPGESVAIKPLTPENGKGTFVMIFSTNPKAVADTIGAFAESQVVADAVTNILNQREVETARILTATQPTSDLAATAISNELASIIPSTDPQLPPAALKRTYLRALETIAQHTGGPASLVDFDAARAWLGRKK